MSEELSTYGEAWQALKDGSKVTHDGYGCWIEEGGCHILFCMMGSPRFVPYHNTEKTFVIHKPPKYDICSHEGVVEIEAFGLTGYQLKGTTVRYELREDGNVFRYKKENSKGVWLGRVDVTIREVTSSHILDVKTITIPK